VLLLQPLQQQHKQLLRLPLRKLCQQLLRRWRGARNRHHM
jgi:hypothetical protein